MRRLSQEEFTDLKWHETWLALSRKVQLRDIGQSYAWVRQWWQSYRDTGVGTKDLFVLVDEDSDGAACIWPLMIRRMGGVRVIEFIGQSGGMTTDYMAPVVRPGGEKQALSNISAFLAENTSLWDVVDLRVSLWSGLYQMFLEDQCVGHGKSSLFYDIAISDQALSITLPRDFETYVASLGRRTRQDVRRYLRAAERAKARLDVRRGRSVLSSLSCLYALNAQNWSIFEDSAARQFMTACAEALISDEEPILLAELTIETIPCATVLGYESNGRCFLHPAGVVRENVAKLSPGTTLYAMLIRELIDNNVSILDMSPGLEEYKFRLGATAEPVYQLRLWHERSRIGRWRSIQWARSAGGPMQWARQMFGKLR